MSELDEQVILRPNEIQSHTHRHPNRPRVLQKLSSVLPRWSVRRRERANFDDELDTGRRALHYWSEGHSGRATFLNTLTTSLRARFKRFRKPSDPNEIGSLNDRANALFARFKQLGRLSDLDEAVVLHRKALELCPEEHPDWAISVNNLGATLLTRFEQLGDFSDLDEALALHRSDLELCPQGHPDRAMSLNSLAYALSTRFGQLGGLSDLDEALALCRSALELRPRGHPDRDKSLNNLASVLSTRFDQLGRLSDLNEALALHRSALELRPRGHRGRAISLNNLANALFSRFHQLGGLSDLNEALVLCRSALELRPQGHPLRAGSLISLASVLSTRFDQLGGLSDLDEALAFYRSALELRPQGHPDRADCLRHLAHCLHSHYNGSSTQHISDLQEAFRLYSHLAEISQNQLVSYADIRCAKQWIQKAEECKHSTTVLAYQTFFRLTIQHITALPSLPQNLGPLKRTISTLAADALSACLRHGNLAGAIELLEQGRGVFWSQLIRLRSPLDDVVASGDTGKELADEFMQVVVSLRNVFDSPQDAATQHDRACSLNLKLQNIISNIRQLPGLSRFLEPPVFSDLRMAASDGPVIVVNASEYSCDALVLLSDQEPVHVPLPITKAHVGELSFELRSLTSDSKFMDVTRKIWAFLRKLWDIVVFPIVEVLQSCCPHQSRIWWCPTAEFSLLPLHAAGSFRNGQPMLSDLYISSYTPTLTALIRARKERLIDPPTESHRFLLIGQARALGEEKLLSVESELSTISDRVGSVTTISCVQAQDANITKISQELPENDLVHFACHGVPNPSHPFESGFGLADGLLKIERIMRYDLQDARFAFLSACHTTVGDEESPDEIIHLAAAMHFAGFRSVIGTMWGVDDAHTNEITSRFYENMMVDSGHLDHTRAAVALHETMRSLRSSDIPFDQQIVYVHIGA